MPEEKDMLDLERQMRELAEAGPQPEPEPEAAPAEKVEEPEKPKETEEPEKPEEAAQGSPDLEEIRLTVEELRLRNEKLEAMLERQKDVASRKAGEAGYWRQRAETAPARQKMRDPEIEEEQEEGEAPAARSRSKNDPEIETLRRRVEDLHSDAASRIIRDEVQEFTRANPDWQEHKEAMASALKDLDPETEEDLYGDNPKLVRKTARTLLREAYADARIAALKEKARGLRDRRAEQMASAAEAKKKATISGSGGAAAPKPQEKPLHELPHQELEARLDRMARQGR